MNKKLATNRVLESIERKIEGGIGAVGQGLLEIQEKQLYKLTHETFEDYCKVRWGFSRPRAYQLIEAEKVKQRLSTIVDTPPSKESHLREIAKAPERKQAKIVAEVLEKCEEEKREPTAKDFKLAVKPFVQAEQKPASKITDKPIQDKAKPELAIKPDSNCICPLCKGGGEWTPDIEFPPELIESEDFMEAWARWTVYRVEKKKKMTPSTQSAALKKCLKVGIPSAIAAITESIENGWTGLFPSESKAAAVFASMNDQGF